ncbi:lipopolysaccharide biosynthesis protein [Sphingomonas sp. R86521]|uniref:lipopolysaccharide biosynthesis protein n=1 Tax=Sphingomonas sp. R86521 TaxID=3093860 RepID=UPI0036D22BAD
MLADRLTRLRAQYGSALVTTGTRLIDLPFRYGMHLLIALQLTLDEVGAFYIVFGTITFVSGLGRLGIDKALTREMARALAHGDTASARASMIRAFLLVGLFSTGIAAIMAAIAWPLAVHVLHKPAMVPLFLIGAAIVVPQNITTVCAGALAGLHRVTLSQVVYTWLWPAAFCAMAVVFEMSDAHALTAVAASMVVSTLIGGGLLIASLPARRDDVVHAYTRPAPLVATGLSLFSLEIVQLLISAAPTFVLGIVAPTAEAGLYSIAWRVVLVIYMFVGGVASMVSPRFARLYALGDKAGLAQESAKAVGYALALAILPIALVTIESGRILGLFGPSFVGATLTLRILLIGQLAATLSTTTPELLGMTGYARSLVRVNTVALVILLAGLAILAPPFGAHGAAAAVTLTMVFSAIAVTIVARRRLGFVPLGALYASMRGRPAYHAAESATPSASEVQDIPSTEEARAELSRMS